MTDAPPPVRRERGFTLLEIMIALAILAVGAICVLSTFAAAIALHLRRESDVRTARVLEEARQEAQAALDAWLPTRDRPFPPPLNDVSYGRDASVSYSVTFEPVSGQPVGRGGLPGGAVAVVKVRQEGVDESRARIMRLYLVRGGFQAGDMKGSVTWEQEQKAAKEGKGKEEPSSEPGAK